MIKRTNEEIMNFFGVEPGDRFEYEGDVYVAESVINFSFYLKCKGDKTLAFTTSEEIQEKIKELPRVSKIGEKVCESTRCSDCPLSNISCVTKTTGNKNTLLEIYNAWAKKTGYHVPELEEELNEEVE